MAFYGEADIETMLKEFGVPCRVILAGVTYDFYGVIDTTDEDRMAVDGGSFAATFKVVEYKTGAAQGATEGRTFTVDGVDHTIVRALASGDGATTRVWLR